MSVYLIRAGESGFVKIGHARNVASRMAGFQTAHYERLTLLRTWPGGQAEEAVLHRAFSEFRINGEWYRFCPAMLDADPIQLAASSPEITVRTRSGSDRPLLLQRVFDAAGGPTKLARSLNISHSSVLCWPETIPHKHVPAISRLTGIPRHELRPDLWEAP
jgi:hypothetical protein